MIPQLGQPPTLSLTSRNLTSLLLNPTKCWSTGEIPAKDCVQALLPIDVLEKYSYIPMPVWFTENITFARELTWAYSTANNTVI
jgi:hypothetical protein